MVRKTSPTEPIVTPFTVVYDDREGLPFRFESIKADADQHHRPIAVQRKCRRLITGDYTIEGFESLVCVERKSLFDLFQTLGQGRSNFKEEHRRMSMMRTACVVIEAPWNEILFNPPAYSDLVPKTIWRTAISWSIRYGVPWYAMPNRSAAESWTYRFLEMFYRHHQHQLKRKGT